MFVYYSMILITITLIIILTVLLIIVLCRKFYLDLDRLDPYKVFIIVKYGIFQGQKSGEGAPHPR